MGPRSYLQPKGMLQRALSDDYDPRSQRRYWGRGLSPRDIQATQRAAMWGFMGEMADLIDETLLQDGHPTAALRRLRTKIMGKPRVVIPASGPGINDDIAEEMAGHVREQVLGMPGLGKTLGEMMGAITHGRSAQEVEWAAWKGQGHTLRPVAMNWVEPRRLSWDSKRQLRIVDAFNGGGSFQDHGLLLREQRPGKFLWWTPRQFNVHHELEGLGPRLLYWSFFKRLSWRHRMIFLEQFALPWRILKLTGEITPKAEEIKAAVQRLERLGAGGGVAGLPEGVDLDVVTPSGQVNIFETTGKDADGEMSKLILGNTATTDGDTATYANTQVLASDEDTIVLAHATSLSEVLTRFAKQFCQWNWPSDEGKHAPSLLIDARPPKDAAAELVKARSLIDMGVPVAESELRDVGGFKRPEDGESYVVSISGGTFDNGRPMPGIPTLIDPSKSEAETVSPAFDIAPAKKPEPESKETEGDEEDKDDKEEPEKVAASMDAGGSALPPFLGAFRWSGSDRS